MEGIVTNVGNAGTGNCGVFYRLSGDSRSRSTGRIQRLCSSDSRIPSTQYVHSRHYTFFKEQSQLTLHVPIVAIAVVAISPIELLRTRMQATNAIGQDIFSVIRGISTTVQSQGIPVLWRGLAPTLWRDVPFSAIYWTLYERIGAMRETKTVADTMSWAFVSGASAGMVSALATLPVSIKNL